MKYEYTNTFIKDVKKSSPELQSQIRSLIEEIKRVERLAELPNVKKMKGFFECISTQAG